MGRGRITFELHFKISDVDKEIDRWCDAYQLMEIIQKSVEIFSNKSNQLTAVRERRTRGEGEK